MAKARAIVKRRKAVRNIKKITKTMQMIATAKFQKSLKRAVGTKPYTLKVRELVAELAASVGNVEHPLLRNEAKPKRVAVIVITSNRGLAGAYNGNVLRKASGFIRDLKKQGVEIDLYPIGKRGAAFFRFAKMAAKPTFAVSDVPAYSQVEPHVQMFVDQFVHGEIDALYVAYMNFISTGVQKPEVTTLLPLSGVSGAADRVAHDLAEKEAQLKAGSMDQKRTGHDVRADRAKSSEHFESIYEFSPSPGEILDELLPLTVKTAFYQSFLDATTSEHVARMVAMKSATDNADKMAKGLTLQYNRARQSQITTELSEIMGGVEAMKGG
ncbi:MAG: ATP synthase F1 subunit gamma [Tepidisphaeraceae bacterium]